MRISELTLETLAEYINIDATDTLLPAMKEAAIAYCVSYTGHTAEELDEYEDVWIAVAALVSDMYDNRSVNVKDCGVNRTVEAILSMHRCNFL